jgi:hypothetical protein
MLQNLSTILRIRRETLQQRMPDAKKKLRVNFYLVTIYLLLPNVVFLNLDSSEPRSCFTEFRENPQIGTILSI